MIEVINKNIGAINENFNKGRYYMLKYIYNLLIVPIATLFYNLFIRDMLINLSNKPNHSTIRSILNRDTNTITIITAYILVILSLLFTLYNRKLFKNRQDKIVYIILCFIFLVYEGYIFVAFNALK